MNFDESLLTAYLDDELSEAERELVEQQLSNSAEHRETLRAISELHRQLAALPAETFTSDVVAEVQRRIGAGAIAGAGLSDEDLASPPSKQATLRGWPIWLSLAMAAGVLAMGTWFSLRPPAEVALREPTLESHTLAEPQAPSTGPPASSLRPRMKRENSAAPAARPPSGAAPMFGADMYDPKAASSEAAGSRADRIAPLSGEPGRMLRFDYQEPAMKTRVGEVIEEAGDEADAATRLPEGTRLFTLSDVAGQSTRQSLGLAAGETRRRRADAAESPQWTAAFATAPLLTYEVPRGQIGEILQWMGNRDADAPEPSPAEPRQLEEAESDADVEAYSDADVEAEAEAEADSDAEGERPVAVLIDVPAEQLSLLLRSIDRRIHEGGGHLPGREEGQDRPAAEELPEPESEPSGKAILVLVPQ